MCTLRTLKTPWQLKVEKEQADQAGCPGKILNLNPTTPPSTKKKETANRRCSVATACLPLKEVDKHIGKFPSRDHKECKYKTFSHEISENTNIVCRPKVIIQCLMTTYRYICAKVILSLEISQHINIYPVALRS